MKEIKAIIRPALLDDVIDVLAALPDLPGVTVSEVMGFGRGRGVEAPFPPEGESVCMAKKMKLEIVVPDALAEKVVSLIERKAHTGNYGDGKVFVINVEETVKIRTGERGEGAV